MDSAGRDKTAPIRLETFERSSRLAEIKAVYRSRRRASERRTILTSRDAAEYLRAAWDKDRIELTEEFLMICLDGSHRALGWVKVSSGGFNAALVDPRVVFSLALQAASTAIVVAHNHPSGSLEPSRPDIELTCRLRDAGELLGIKLLDHIIVASEGYRSLADDGLI